MFTCLRACAMGRTTCKASTKRNFRHIYFKLSVRFSSHCQDSLKWLNRGSERAVTSQLLNSITHPTPGVNSSNGSDLYTQILGRKRAQAGLHFLDDSKAKRELGAGFIFAKLSDARTLSCAYFRKAKWTFPPLKVHAHARTWDQYGCY